jgi:TonB family protein
MQRPFNMRKSGALGAALVMAMSGAYLAGPAGAVEDGSKGGWQVDFGTASCRLIRNFGGASDGRLEIERNWAFGGYGWTLFGAGLPEYNSAKPIEVVLGAETARRFDTGGNGKLWWYDKDASLFAALPKNDQIAVTGPKSLKVAAGLPKAAAAVQALETCENELIKSWGSDAAQFRALAATAQPSGGVGRWVTNDDLTREDISRRREGDVTFLLTVDVAGKVSDCRVVVGSGHPSLDARTCSLLRSRASFRPARDATGQNVASFYVNKIRWQLPR